MHGLSTLSLPFQQSTYASSMIHSPFTATSAVLECLFASSQFSHQTISGSIAEEISRVEKELLYKVSDIYADLGFDSAEDAYSTYLKIMELSNNAAFKGKTETRLHCNSCQRRENNIQDFLDISLPVPPETTTLEKLLESNSGIQPLDQYTCPQCGAVNSTIQHITSKISKVLVFDFKRMGINGVVDTFIDFPTSLNISGVDLHLFAVVNFEAGRFIPLVKYDGQWWEKDSKPRRISENRVPTKFANLVFYSRENHDNRSDGGSVRTVFALMGLSFCILMALDLFRFRRRRRKRISLLVRKLID